MTAGESSKRLRTHWDGPSHGGRSAWRSPTDVLPERSTGPDNSVEDRASLVAALQHLPGQQRATVLLRHWVGLSVAEVAAELGISEGTVKSHSSRGLAALRSLLAAADA